MDTITAQAIILDLFAGRAGTPPDEWLHDLTDGSLSYRYRGSDNTFTWPEEAVAAIARRGSDVSSAAGRAVLESWDAIERLFRSEELKRPDRMIYADREIELVWDSEKVVVIVEREEPALCPPPDSNR